MNRNSVPMAESPTIPQMKVLHSAKVNGHEKATKTDDTMNAIEEKSRSLSEMRLKLIQEEAKLAEELAAQEAAARQEKTEKRAALLEDIADWREMAHTSNDPERAKAYFSHAKKAESEAVELGIELGLTPPATMLDAGPAAKAKRQLSSTKAIWFVVLLFFISLATTHFLGRAVLADPNNAMGQSMVSNSSLRASLAFTLTFLTVLIAFAFIRLFFPQFYSLWHNRIESERSLDTLVQESPAWAVLAGLLLLLALFAGLFSGYYQALYA